MTECSETLFPFEAHFSRQVVAQFEGSWLTTEGGSLLLRQADRKIGLLRRVARCFTDYRQPERIEHRLEEMLAQRIYGLALGYEDLNDHEQLRQDPLLGVLAGKRDLSEPLAGKSTLNRLELTPAGSPAAERSNKIAYSPEAIDELLVTLFLESHRKAPQSIVLDLDATDTPLHGKQEGRFFHGYYNHYCYLPLYIFCGDQLLCARLRPSNIDASAGSLEEVQRIVTQLRRAWPHTQIILRADSGFCREELMVWCEQHAVDYVFGFARNQRLRRKIAKEMRQAKKEQQRTGEPARVFTEFFYQTRKTWSRNRRVIAKAEQIPGKENPRYVVTSLPRAAWPTRELYEQLYCARGEMENRIKEQRT
jgi:Transposase DDE domain group 1